MKTQNNFCQTGTTLSLDFDLLQKYQRNKTYCDLFIQSTKDDSKAIIPCHKIVLSTISPYFRRQLEEQDKCTIYLEGTDQSTLQSLIDYIYSGGEINLTSENVYKIYAGAQELMLDKLMDYCIEYIKILISVKDVMTVYSFAQTYFLENLSDACLKFIVKYFEEVKPHGFFNLDFARVKLILEHQLQVRSSPAEDILKAVVEWLHKDEKARLKYAFYLLQDIPLVEIDPKILRNLFREDICLRNIQVVYDLFMDAVEETKSEDTDKSKRKSDCTFVPQNIDNEGEAATTRSPKRPRSSEPNMKQERITLSDSLCISKSTENISVNPGSRAGEDVRYRNKPLAYFVCSGMIIPEKRSLVEFNLESKKMKILTTHTDFDGLSSLVYKNGKIYSLGGMEVQDSVRSNIVSVFDINTKTWETIRRGNKKVRAGFKSIVLGDYIYAIGGASLKGTTQDVERFPVTHSSKKWAHVSKLLYPRYDFGMGIVNGHIYVVGGWAWNKRSEVMLSIGNTTECYDPVTKEWSAKSPMPNGRRGLAVATVGPNLYAIGGGDLYGLVTATVDVYDTLRDTWETGIPMGKKRQYFSAVTFNNCIYVIGGDSADHPTMEKFDIEQQVWEDMGSVPSNGFYHSVEIHTGTWL